MSLLGWYVMVGLPCIALLMGYGGVLLVRADYAKLDKAEKRDPSG